jgi:recombination protein RecT
MENNKVQKVDISSISKFEKVWNNYEKTVAKILNNKYGISVDEFMINAINSIRKNPELLKCTPKSLFGAMLMSAECGLQFNTPSQHAYIIPFKNKGVYEASFQIGYQGLVECMYRNERVLKIYGNPVFSEDKFSYGYGLKPFLNHIPKDDVENKKLVAVYSVVHLKGCEEPIFTVVRGYELEKIKKLSFARNSSHSPYNSGSDVFNWMQVKVAIKKISKLIPKTNNDLNIINIDNNLLKSNVSAEIITNPNEVADFIFTEESIFSNDFVDFDDVTDIPEKKPVIEPKKISKSKKYGLELNDLDNLTENLEIKVVTEENNIEQQKENVIEKTIENNDLDNPNIHLFED